jgi:hypothetical protein
MSPSVRRISGPRGRTDAPRADVDPARCSATAAGPAAATPDRPGSPDRPPTVGRVRSVGRRRTAAGAIGVAVGMPGRIGRWRPAGEVRNGCPRKHPTLVD